MPTATVTGSELAHEMRQTIGRVVRRLRAEPGPPAGRLAVLSRLEREGPASISDLATAEHMRPQSMAQTIRELEADGLTSRSADPSDGRKAVIELTDDGVELLRATRAGHETWLAAVLERELDVDERERLHEALELIARIAAA